MLSCVSRSVFNGRQSNLLGTLLHLPCLKSLFPLSRAAARCGSRTFQSLVLLVGHATQSAALALTPPLPYTSRLWVIDGPTAMYIPQHSATHQRPQGVRSLGGSSSFFSPCGIHAGKCWNACRSDLSNVLGCLKEGGLIVSVFCGYISYSQRFRLQQTRNLIKREQSQQPES